MIYVLSGGGSKGAQKKATIVVAYPSGATCTVSNGSKTYTALDTSGSAAFVVDAGAWTVKISQSGQTDKTKAVTVEAGKYAEVELYFELSLFGNGVDNTSVTGGFAASASNCSFSVSDNQLVLAQTPDSFGNHFQNAFGPTNKIDLTDYSIFRVTIDSTTAANGFIAAASGFDYATMNASTCQKSAAAAGTYDLDVSSMNGEYYVAWCIYVPSGTNTYKFSKFALIP